MHNFPLHSSISIGYHTFLARKKFGSFYDKNKNSQLKQTHSSLCHYRSKASHFKKCGDAQWTDIPGLQLSVGFADCIPFLFYATNPKLIVGTLHAGRRGVAKNIVGNMINQLKDHAIDISTLHIRIGPSICNNCFEFGADGSDPYQYFDTACIQANDHGTRQVDTRVMLRRQLIDGGVNPANISEDNRCTVETESLTSRRRDKKIGMNNYAWIEIENKIENR